MTRKKITLMSSFILLVWLIVGGAVSLSACTREVVKEVPKEVIKEGPTVPMSLPNIAQAIEKGEIDVGKEYGLQPGQRYHKIHATVLGLECTTCHISKPDATQAVFNAQDVSPQAPGPVERKSCLGCHRAGPGHNLYGPGGP